MTDFEKLAELLFNDITETPEDILNKYPKRELKEGTAVTRFAPSPTGFLHIGGLFAALISKKTAQMTDGIFYLRIEDTDKKREIENGIALITDGLNAFGVTPDEGFINGEESVGNYGPYRQRERENIYKVFAKRLVEEGKAYPCFCDEDTLTKLREEQVKEKVRTGYYGKYTKCRDLSFDEIKANIDAGKPYVLRLKSVGSEENKIKFNDLIKGTIEMPQNDQDIVLLKQDGIPTYHFAHAVDDTLMGTTHVIRGDEWISSVPVHIELFRSLGFRVPKYAHIAPIMKEEDGGKRKLSKRKDPEAAVSYYDESGYPRESVTEYLMTLANSDFEEWRKHNQGEDINKFPFKLKKMSVSGALFDLQKLNDVSKNVISRMTADDVLKSVLDWSEKYDKELFDLINKDKIFARNILNIDRENKKPRKDIAKWNEVKDYAEYFYDELWQRERELPENISAEDAKSILESYLKVYNKDDDKDTWFSRMKEICEPLGFASEVKAYKASPDDYKGHVGDVSTVIRIAVTGRRNTPDLYEIMKLLKDKATDRIKEYSEILGG
jgi:glutamyl-tRNA synthetase